MNLAEEYLKIAKKDLKATKILYENKLYAQALFYFEQSVEKANKVLALTSNKYSEKDMINFNHDVTRIYKDNIIEQKRRYENLSRNLNQISELKNTEFVKNFDIESRKKECEEFLRNLAEIQTERNDLIFISTWEIRDILTEISENDKEIKDSIKSVSNFRLTENDWEEMKNDIFKQFENPNNNNLASSLQKEMDDSKLSIQELETGLKKMYLQMIHLMSVSSYLYHLGILTLPHAVIARYPKGDLSPMDIYNQKLPIIKYLPDLIEQHSKALKILNKYYNEYYLNPAQ
ncbi:MAG: HEPN domain-containing protein [Methanosarcinales archaeon]|uniref:HEPN domain-containing protein n=1 Tax=Candidatus Ethanoperedens thermophilum TaxID=2766897 RepID=A0A848DAL0_9EURY|nr:HEPN domain-containing protein [Candidatus Ethanoperedens thermophilum]